MSETDTGLLLGLLKRHFFSRTDRAAVLNGHGKPMPVVVDDSSLDALLLTHLLGETAPAAVARYVTKKTTGVMKGHYRVGSYTPAPDGMTAWLCLDIDGAGHAEAVADPDGAARVIVERFQRYGLPAYLERSGGGKGWHVWLLFETPVPAAKARELACAVIPRDIPLARGGYADPEKQKGIEVFPKQDKIAGNGYGNLVWLPWWTGARDGGNRFYQYGENGFCPFVPGEFACVPPKDIDPAIERAALDALANAYDAIPLPNGPEDFSGDWEEWRKRALAALSLESVYGPWLTGRSSTPGWLECRDPDSPSGDQNPSAGAADGTNDAERGSFHSFISGKTMSVFDFMVSHGLAVDFPHALRRVAELSGQSLFPKRQGKASAASPASASGGPARQALPVIRVNNRQLQDMVHDTWQSVFRLNTRPDIFLRQDALVRLRHWADGPGIEDMTENGLYAYLSRTATWVKETQEATVDALAPREIAKAMLAEPHETLPEIESVLTCPVFGTSGALISRPGYHREDKAWYEPGKDLAVPDAPDNPAPEDIAAARSLLVEELAGDFPFVSESDRTHWLAALILPFVRRMINGPTPLHFVEAPCNGAGKSLLCDIVSIVATGQSAHAQTLPTHDDEAAKTITAELLDGRSIILLDNQNEKSRLNCPPLASVLTAQHWTGRLLGQSKMLTLPNRAAWLMTGNNPNMTTEMARRCLRIRIDPRRDRAWQRDPLQFKHPKLKAWTLAHRGDLIHAIHVLVNAWLAAGKPDGKGSMGSFEDWAGVIGGILGVAGVPGFLECLDEMYRQADPDAEAWKEFVSTWWGEFADTPRKVSELNELCERENLLASLRGDRSLRSQETRLGLALNAMRDRMFGNLRIAAAENAKYAKGGRLYQLVLNDDDTSREPHRNSQTELFAEEPEKHVSDADSPVECGPCADVVRTFETKGPHIASPETPMTSETSLDECGRVRTFSPVPRVYARAHCIEYKQVDRACAHVHAHGGSLQTSANVRTDNDNHPVTKAESMGCTSADVGESSHPKVRTTSALGPHWPENRNTDGDTLARAPDSRGEAWEDPNYVEPTFPDGSRVPDPWDPDYSPGDEENPP